MKHRICYSVAVLLSVIPVLRAAPLVLETEVEDFLMDVARQPTVKVQQTSDTELLGTSMVTGRPVAYKVINRNMTRNEVNEMVAEVGVDTEGKCYAGYDTKKGYCFFYTPHLTRLKDASDAALRKLQFQSRVVLKKLLKERSSLFVLANTETDWEITREDTVPHRTMFTCRFTRKLNGRQVIGNDAFARISFTGSGEVCGFEFCDPELVPVPVERMVLPAATGERLRRYAENKNTAHSTMRGDITVAQVTATRGVASYIARTSGGEKILVPSVSILCRLRLSNGESFEKYRHFSLDATTESNIDDSMLERMVR
ncbi:MAG: hypothetical protein JW863_16695 [Chitinispirillaceae bacterium]|nr:hypothetical protein [Chitinispirillaceae bacterium]